MSFTLTSSVLPSGSPSKMCVQFNAKDGCEAATKEIIERHSKHFAELLSALVEELEPHLDVNCDNCVYPMSQLSLSFDAKPQKVLRSDESMTKPQLPGPAQPLRQRLRTVACGWFGRSASFSRSNGESRLQNEPSSTLTTLADRHSSRHSSGHHRPEMQSRSVCGGSYVGYPSDKSRQQARVLDEEFGSRWPDQANSTFPTRVSTRGSRAAFRPFRVLVQQMNGEEDL